MEVIFRPTSKPLKEEQKHVSVIHMCIYSACFWLIVFPVTCCWCGTARLRSFQKRYCIRNYPTAALLATVSHLGSCVLVFVCQEAWNVALLQTLETIWNADLFTRLSVYSVQWTDGEFGRRWRSVTLSFELDYWAVHALQFKAPSCDLSTVVCINEQQGHSAPFLSFPHWVHTCSAMHD